MKLHDVVPMTAGIVTNVHKDPDLTFTRDIRRFLEARGVAVVPEGETADFWVVLGGDGTVLAAAHKAALLDVPLLGINLGTMGFLTDVDKQDGFTALRKVIAGEYESQKRLMLKCAVAGWKGTAALSCNNLALNEVVVGNAGRLAYFSVYVNGVHIDDIRAGGIIVSTPTGSTAYNLSAGGPILSPCGEMIVITAICPHSLSARPWVIPAGDNVRIVPAHSAALVLDGEVVSKVPGGSGVEISRAPVSATIIHTVPANFYEILRKKKII